MILPPAVRSSKIEGHTGYLVALYPWERYRGFHVESLRTPTGYQRQVSLSGGNEVAANEAEIEVRIQ